MKQRSLRQRRRGASASGINFTALILVLASRHPGHAAVIRRRERITHNSVVRRIWEGVLS